MKKRILWITADYFVDVDFSLVPYLMENNPELEIKWIVISNFNSNIQVSSELGCEVYTLGHKSKSPCVIKDYYKLFASLHVSKFDLIYSDVVNQPFYFPLLLLLAHKTPIIHAAHNVIPYSVWSFVLRQYVRFIFNFNKHFQLFSKFTAEYFEKKYPKKSFFYAPMVVKDFGEVRTSVYNFDTTKYNLLFFGEIRRNKRLDLLIEAMKRLPQAIQDRVHLNICGKCPSGKEHFLQMIGNSKCISTYFKRIPDEEIPELFSKSQYLMLPYEDVAQSGPQMIAYNYNLPVIASDIDGFRERVCDGVNGFLFNRNNVDDLVNTIVKAVSINQKEYIEIKCNLEAFVNENYSCWNVSKRYIEYIDGLS